MYNDTTIYVDIDPTGQRLTSYQREQRRRLWWASAEDLAYHNANLHVYYRLRQLALDLVNRGHKKHSIKGLFEVLRYQQKFETTGDSFKLNNNLTPFYSRLLMQEEPRLAGFFYLRRSKKVSGG
jgi:hypothetical protein